MAVPLVAISNGKLSVLELCNSTTQQQGYKKKEQFDGCKAT